MILSEKIEINTKNRSSYWKGKGYDIKDKVEVYIKDLPSGSGYKIKVSCDICNKEKEITLNRYNINTKNGKTYYSCSRKCSEQKNKNTLNEKYGVDNISKSIEIKIKKVETSLLKNGVEYPMQNEEIFNKSKLSKLKNHGNENYNNQDKRYNSCLSKYGYKTACENENIKEKLKKSKYSKKEILEMCNEKHGNFYEYLDFDYKNTRSSLNIICKNHGKFTQMVYKHIQGQGCPVCNESKGEREIRNYLNDNNILFESQKRFKNFNFPFDFYLPEKELLIEYDGIQHFEPVEIFGGEKAFFKQKENDILKNNFCKEKRLKLLRISYLENIKEKLNKI